MKKTLLILLVIFAAHLCVKAQQTTFVPNCAGSNDTTAFSNIITAIGSNVGTIQLPYKASAARCAVNNLTVPANVTLDNNNGSGIKVNTGQTLTVNGPIANPASKQFFYNATTGLGTVSFSGSRQVSHVYSEWWGAVADNSTNCTSAINASLAAIFTAGKGTLELLTGTYYVGGSVNATSGGLIYPPQNSWTGGLNQTMVSISIVGAAKATWGDYGVIGGGTVIRSDVTYSGAIAVPAILSAKVYTSGIAETDFNIIDLHVENVIFRTYDNPSIGGVNLMMARRGSVRNVVADVGVTETTGSSTGPSNPTSTVYGIAMPKTPNNGQATIENSVATGYRFGFYGADHTRYVGFCMAARCLYGFVFETATGYATGHLYSYRNLHDFFFIGTKNIVYLTIQSEVDNTSGTWTQRTIGTTVDFQDDADITHGTIWYLMETPDGLHTNYTPTTTGLSSVDKISTYNGKNTTFTNVFDITSTPVLRNPSHEVIGSKALVAGTVTVTIPVGLTFTSDTTYQCTANDVTAINAVQIVKVSGSQFTLNGTATDVIAFRCTGS